MNDTTRSLKCVSFIGANFTNHPIMWERRWPFVPFLCVWPFVVLLMTTASQKFSLLSLLRTSLWQSLVSPADYMMGTFLNNGTNIIAQKNKFSSSHCIWSPSVRLCWNSQWRSGFIALPLLHWSLYYLTTVVALNSFKLRYYERKWPLFPSWHDISFDLKD